MSDANPGLDAHLSSALQEGGVRALDDPELFQQLVDSYCDSVGEWAEIRNVLKRFGCLSVVEKRVRAKAHEQRSVRQIARPRARGCILDKWPDAPVSRETFAPDDYVLTQMVPAVERSEPRMIAGERVFQSIPVSLDPILITRQIGHVQTSDLLLEVAWRNAKGQWKTGIFEREVLMSSRKIVDTSREGMPVSSTNAPELVRWLQAYEHQNQLSLPRGFVTHSMGWQGTQDDPTKSGFLCGTQQIGGNGKAIELTGSDGDLLEAREIHHRGDADAWRDALGKIAHFEAVRVAIYASLSAPLVAVLDAPNAIIEWAGRTSTGKSTVLKIAQSCWRSGETRLATWNSTMIGIENQAAAGSDLPLFIDDTSAAVDGGRSQSIGKVVYQLVSGRARGRGAAAGGNRVRASWRTVVLSTGETPIAELAKAEGAAARVLTFWSAPLGPNDPATAELATEALFDLSQHFGHAGPAVVRWLCEHREHWEALRELARGVAKAVRDRFRTPAASRLSEVVGLLDAAAYVAHEALELPWPKRSVLDDPAIVAALTNAVELSSASADRAASAHEHVMSVAHSRPRSWLWYGTEPGGEGAPSDSQHRDPPGGWLGYRSRHDTKGPMRFAWHRHHLYKVLEEGGYSPEAVLRAWRDTGVLYKPNKGRFTRQVQPGGRDGPKIRLIVVKEDFWSDHTSDE